MSDSYITKPPKAWVFGAGITGLTVAHELVERGFDVTVVEPAQDPRSDGNHPAVGGVARSQFAWLPKGAAERADAQPLGKEGTTQRTIPQVRLPPLFVSLSDIREGVALGPDNEARLERFCAQFRERCVPDGRALTIRVIPTFGAGTPSQKDANGVEVEPDELARRFGELVVEFLRARLPSPVDVLLAPVDTGTGETRRRRARPQELWASLEVVNGGEVPGEHGFRYFPGFYRHLFDTMRRTVVAAGDDGAPARFWKSAKDNLAPTEATWLVVKNREARPDAPADRYDLVSFPRRQPRSLPQLFGQLQAFLKDLGYSVADLSRLTLKLFQYMTTSSERRAAEFEDATWWDFIDGERFTPICRDHMDRGPEVLGAMTAKESDARTQGNCVVQLLMDQIVGRELTDATLNGPTTEVWFDLWYEYLRRQKVRFIEGRLTGFRQPRSGERPDVLLPEIERFEVEGEPITFDAKSDHWFFVCTSAAAMMGFPEFRPGGLKPGEAPKDEGLADLFLAQHDALIAAVGGAAAGERADFERARDWRDAMRAEHQRGFDANDPEARRRADARGLGPLRHLTGVQYFFGANVQFGQEHTLYMDSPWRLSSISQTHFWGRLAVTVPGYRGIVSVDLGALHQPDEATPDRAARTAWECGRDAIQQRVWEQVGPSVSVDTLRDRREPWPDPRGGTPPSTEGDVTQGAPRSRSSRGVIGRVAVPLPVFDRETLLPMAYHLDENLEFEFDGSGRERVARNTAPYLINRPKEFRLRPGDLRDDAKRTQGYSPQNHRWLLAGTYMKTFTRLTTMEAANESARHAVNAALHARQVQGDRCMIWDPEECELPDLAPLREIDRRLFADGYPHLVDILGLESIPDALMPSGAPTGAP